MINTPGVGNRRAEATVLLDVILEQAEKATDLARKSMAYGNLEVGIAALSLAERLIQIARNQQKFRSYLHNGIGPAD